MSASFDVTAVSGFIIDGDASTAQLATPEKSAD
jgi:hypothetical protein